MKKFYYLIPIFVLVFVLNSHFAFASVLSDNSAGGTIDDMWFNHYPPNPKTFSPATDFGSTDSVGSADIWAGMENTNWNCVSSGYSIAIGVTDQSGNTYYGTVSDGDIATYAVGGGVAKIHINFTLHSNPSLPVLDFSAGYKVANVYIGDGAGNACGGPNQNWVNLEINGDNTPKYILYDSHGAVLPLAITNPLPNSEAPASSQFEITGTCPHDGTKVLGYSPDITQLDLFPIAYSIDCTSGHFTFTKNITGGSHIIYVVDSTDNNFATVSFTATDDPNVQITSPNQLKLIYPDITDGPNHYTIHPAAQFPFRFQYKFADQSNYDTAVFRMSNCNDITFVSCTLGANFFVKAQDTRPNGNFDVLINITNGTDYYFTATLYDSYPSPTWTKTIDFVVHGDNNSTVLPDAGDIGGNCTNFLCDLFIPSTTFWDGFYSDAQATLSTKVPFYYYYQLKNSYLGVNTTASDGYLINTTLTSVDANGHTLISVPFQLLNTADTKNKTIFNDFRPYISAGLWLMFGFYLFTRAFRVFVPE